MRVLEIGLCIFADRFGVPSDHTNWHNIIEGIEKAIRSTETIFINVRAFMQELATRLHE